MDAVLARRIRRRSFSIEAGLAAVIVCLAACASRPRIEPAMGAGEASERVDFRGVPYLVDASESELHVLVYRAGTLARLGHNHVIAARGLSGRVYLSPDSAGSGIALELPVDELEVDPQGLRDRYGERFSSPLTAADIEGTRANMLGPDLLDAGAHPTITITGNLRGDTDPRSLAVSILIKGNMVQRDIPVTLLASEELIVAEGSAELSHAELGLTPFSVMLGALQVADGFEVRFRILARRAAES